jgi:CO/xanthine dehydrogenase Mo-binding subunit
MVMSAALSRLFFELSFGERCSPTRSIDAALGRSSNKSNVTSLNWVSYPVLRFAETPDVVLVAVQRLEEPSTGAGEEVMGATAAAIANAFFDATGKRMQEYPMTSKRVLEVLKA